MPKTTAIVLAAGKGRRMGEKIAKQYLLLSNKPVLTYALETFNNSKRIDEIVLVLPKDEIEYCKEKILAGYSYDKLKYIIPGGEKRSDSVMNAIGVCDDSDYCLIHDAARPFITNEIIETIYDGLLRFGACVCGVPVVDTIKKTDENNFITETVDRLALWQIQTPQAFSVEKIRMAYEKYIEDGCPSVTDDAMVYEKYGIGNIKMVMGSYDNIKLTTPFDMLVGEMLMAKRNSN